MKRPCLEPGCPHLAPPGKPRCPTHQAAHDRPRNARRNARRTHYRGDWAAIARAAVEAHRATHGDWCPGWNRPPHPATDLTCDHVIPRSLAAGVQVLCRSCNARKGARTPTLEHTTSSTSRTHTKTDIEHTTREANNTNEHTA